MQLASALLVENGGVEPPGRTPLLCRRWCDRTIALSMPVLRVAGLSRLSEK